jgi:hypothetical protein
MNSILILITFEKERKRETGYFRQHRSPSFLAPVFSEYIPYTYCFLPSLLSYAVFFFPILVSILPNTHVTANSANTPKVITIGFLYPAVQG